MNDKVVDLIKELSEASSGSRELDYAVLQAALTLGTSLQSMFPDENSILSCIDFTTNVENAMKLAPYDVAVTVLRLARKNDEPTRAMAKIQYTRSEKEPYTIEDIVAQAATPALAVCIVALQYLSAVN